MYNRQVAETMYRQLGGGKFKAMTGAYNFVFGDEDGNVFLQCRFKGSRKANYMKVVYNYGADTYRMIFKKLGRAPKYKVTEVADHNGVYCDMLQPIFEEVTGLYTHL